MTARATDFTPSQVSWPTDFSKLGSNKNPFFVPLFGGNLTKYANFMFILALAQSCEPPDEGSKWETWIFRGKKLKIYTFLHNKSAPDPISYFVPNFRCIAWVAFMAINFWKIIGLFPAKMNLNTVYNNLNSVYNDFWM